ncbi:MAG: hypothetical protein AB7Q81_11735 [Gammaproteobacteria bacterium]
MVLATFLTTPFVPAGRIAMWLAEQGAARRDAWHIDWLPWSESGGRWLLAVVLGESRRPSRQDADRLSAVASRDEFAGRR